MAEPKYGTRANPRICRSAPDKLVDFFVTDVESVRFEATETAQWSIGIYLTDGRAFRIDCGAKDPNAESYARIKEEDRG